MVKIKTKKEMTLPELIQWGWDNPELVKGKIINPKNKTLESVHFLVSNRVMVGSAVSKYDIYTVEVGEEIKENTIIPKLFYLYEYAGSLATEIFYDSSIKQVLVLDDYGSDADSRPIAFYMLNDDYTMTLIWKNGEMVE